MNKAIAFHSDILGFKEIIDNSEDDSNDETLDRFKKILDQSVGMLEMFSGLHQHTKTVIRYKLFSDNLYASFSYTEADYTSFCDAFIIGILFARNYYENMLNNELVVRGGISYGNDYSDERMIFSKALVKAYLLESQKAKYPRIVVDEELVTKLKSTLEVPTQLILSIVNNSVLYDDTGIFFLNPSGIAKDFNSRLNHLAGEELDRAFLQKNLSFVEAERQKYIDKGHEYKPVVEKYDWLHSILRWNYDGRPNDVLHFNPLNFQKSSK